MMFLWFIFVLSTSILSGLALKCYKGGGIPPSTVSLEPEECPPDQKFCRIYLQPNKQKHSPESNQKTSSQTNSSGSNSTYPTSLQSTPGTSNASDKFSPVSASSGQPTSATEAHPVSLPVTHVAHPVSLPVTQNHVEFPHPVRKVRQVYDESNIYVHDCGSEKMDFECNLAWEVRCSCQFDGCNLDHKDGCGVRRCVPPDWAESAATRFVNSMLGVVLVNLLALMVGFNS